jgi:geranylgeranyl reductase family protein
VVEVLIAGAGPAGSAAAIALARAGVRVLLVDRARFPRPKLCGDTLNPGALAVLERLGVSLSGVASLPLDGMRVTSGRGTVVTGSYGRHQGLAIRRDVLDQAMLQAAARAGAQVEEGVRVTGPLLDESGGPAVVRGAVLDVSSRPLRVPAAWTIGAEGRRSPLALALRLSEHPARPRRWAIGAYYEGVAALSRYGEMHLRRGHYVGVAPLADGLANACVVTADRRRLARPQELLQETFERDPLLRERFADARRVSAIQCVGPLAVQARGCGMTGLLLAGDAAGFIDPMTGDGVRFALRGGLLAAEAILRAYTRSPVPPQHWLAAARRREFGGKQCINRLLRGLVGWPTGLAFSELAGASMPGLVRTLIRMAADLPRSSPGSK